MESLRGRGALRLTRAELGSKTELVVRGIDGINGCSVIRGHLESNFREVSALLIALGQASGGK